MCMKSGIFIVNNYKTELWSTLKDLKDALYPAESNIQPTLNSLLKTNMHINLISIQIFMSIISGKIIYIYQKLLEGNFLHDLILVNADWHTRTIHLCIKVMQKFLFVFVLEWINYSILFHLLSVFIKNPENLACLCQPRSRSHISQTCYTSAGNFQLLILLSFVITGVCPYFCLM